MHGQHRSPLAGLSELLPVPRFAAQKLLPAGGANTASAAPSGAPKTGGATEAGGAANGDGGGHFSLRCGQLLISAEVRTNSKAVTGSVPEPYVTLHLRAAASGGQQHSCRGRAALLLCRTACIALFVDARPLLWQLDPTPNTAAPRRQTTVLKAQMPSASARCPSTPLLFTSQLLAASHFGVQPRSAVCPVSYRAPESCPA